MARRRSSNRKRNSRRRSVDSVGSELLDPDTNIVDEEQTFWWNHLQENTFPPHSLIYSRNETARQLNVSSLSQTNSSPGPSEWWKNLEHSGSEHGASASPRRNLSAAILKANILQSSTSESEKELDLRKRKVRLKAAYRKSVNNAFLNALDNTEATIPLKLRMKQANYSNFHADSDREVSQKELQEDEEDSSNMSSTGNILKSKPSISRRRKDGGAEDQNPFQDILTEDGVSNDSITRKSVVLEKESSKHSMHQNIDTSKDNADKQRKSIGSSQVTLLENIETEALKLNSDSSKLTPVENVRVSNANEIVQSSDETDIQITNGENVRVSNANEIVQSSDESDIQIIRNKRLKLKSRFMQRTRKSVGKNTFADALADDSSSTYNPNKENDIYNSPILLQTPLSPSKRSVNRSKTVERSVYRSTTSTDSSFESLPVRRSPRTNIYKTHESSSIRISPRVRSPRVAFLNANKKLSLDMQAKDIIEMNSSSSSLDNNESRRKTSIFLKAKSRILKNLRKSLTKNSFAEICEEDNISARESNVSTEDNHVSVERDETTRISQVHGSLATDKSSQSKRDKTVSEEDSDNMSLCISTASSNVEKSTSKKSNSENKSKPSENSDLTNASKSISLSPEIHLTRLRNGSETSKPANIEVRDSRPSKRVSKSSPGKETHLTSNSFRNRSETPKPANIEVRDSSPSKRVSKSSPGKETRLTPNSFRNRSETPKPASKTMELPKRSINWIADIEEEDNADSEINISDISHVTSSTRISKVSANIGIHKSTILSAEMEITDDEDADSEMQVIQRNSISTKAGTSSKAVNRQGVQTSNRTSIQEDRETGRRQRSLNTSQNYHSKSPTKLRNKDTSFSVKPNSSKSLRKIDDFFKVKQTSTTMDKRLSDRAQVDAEKMEKIKAELEKIKNREMAAMKIAATDKKQSALKTKSVKSVIPTQATKKKKPIAKPMRVVDKAFLVNGKVYKAPKLPRPKHWATNRLYKFLWNRMEPKYKFRTRVRSEKFVQELAKIVSIIERRKNYENYKTEMNALMKEMARLNIINTRNDFYHFCQDFLPYEFRVKVVPMLLPGNKSNIPYDPEKLHIPLLDT